MSGLLEGKLKNCGLKIYGIKEISTHASYD
jgi:hypothetical protein